MLYKATEKFQELGIENSYHFLTCEQYFDLRSGKEVECTPRPYLIEGGYVEKVGLKIREVKREVKGDKDNGA